MDGGAALVTALKIPSLLIVVDTATYILFVKLDDFRVVDNFRVRKPVPLGLKRSWV